MPPPPSSYLRMDKVQKAEDRIKTNKWDVEAWSVLLRSAQCKHIEEARDIYERIVTQFPLSGQYWKIYIQAEMKSQNYESVEKLFQRCLVKIHHIDLWKLYIQYIKETKAKHPNFKEKMAQAYDFTLDRMGLDLNFYSVWTDYITFLRSAQVTGSYAESQKITATRRVYQRAIVTPMSGIETIWRDYCQYESSINPAIAKKFTEDRAKEHNNAKRVTKEYEAVTKGLSKNMPSVPPQNTPYEVKQVELWKRYIQWEKENPLKTEDIIVITKRVMFAYEQCLLCLGHHPDIWYEAATYLEQATKQLSDKGDLAMARQFADETALMYERAIALLSDNMMLYFAYADYEENRGKFNKVHSIYKKLISLKDINPTLPYIQYMRSTRRCEGISAARMVFKSSREDTRVHYQVYVAAAYMEYFCTKDKGIAHRIFELGMKRFSSDADFISAYLDFMSILNEDNNTRVLFERSLGSSSQVAQDKTCHVWSRFLQFELQVGDLSSILKVERRRLEILNNIKKECKGKETALLIDRYRFLDLFPCTESELRSLGYRELVRMGITGSINTDLIGHEETFHGPSTGEDTHNQFTSRSKGSYPKPDVAQMLPYKPKAYPRTGSHVVPGGEFPPPPAASALLKIMPPPECFSGPFVQIDKFMENFLGIELSDDYLWGVTCESEDLANNIDPGTALSIEMAASNSLLLKGSLPTANGANKKVAGEKRAASVIGRSLNAYGDSEDDDSELDEDEENAEGESGNVSSKTSSWKSMRQEALLMKAPVASNPGFLDLFRLRNAKKKLKAT